MRRKTFDVVVIGSINVDLTTETARLPQAGETVIGRRSLLSFGGKGANQAVAAARLGSSVALVGRVGDDLFGRQARDHLSRCGVDIGLVKRTSGVSTGLAAIVVSRGGESRIIVTPGANAALQPAHVAPLRRLIAGAEVLLLQLEVPLPTVRVAVQEARQMGTRVILNPAPAQRLPRSLLGALWCLVANRTEAELLCGRRAGGRRGAVQMARLLLARGEKARGGKVRGGQRHVENVLVTLGRRGVVWVGDEGARHWPARQAQTVDTTGAGDAFVGSFAHGIAQRLPFGEAVEQATLYAALATERLGAQSSYVGKTAFRRALRGLPAAARRC